MLQVVTSVMYVGHGIDLLKVKKQIKSSIFEHILMLRATLLYKPTNVEAR